MTVLHGAARQAERGLKTAALFALGGILTLIGMGFLTVAGWISLATAYDRTTAALVLGFVYFGPGILVIAATRQRTNPVRNDPPYPDPGNTSEIASLLQAFIGGVDQGIRTRKSERK
ncbi:phage holin family protein [Actibacterium sp. D379-3]